ncbi:MAG TPA: aminomethyl-transferring glycine dehydrogenase subunit GcvPA [Spirochaetia bacterium]|nr:aminomethyl-transferring glycine dehydrogenase subunit GcvPA [Spirochaetia bacterium]
MSFIPNTEADRARMREVIGISSNADLFTDVPEKLRFPRLDLPGALSELEVLAELDAMARLDTHTGQAPSFLGAGAYHHFIPAVVDAMVSRSEFATAYTPYQPEISQGTLQAIFEYQSMIARLTGMDVSNASHYDGATSTAEAVIMALNVAQKQRRCVILSRGLHPQYRAVVRTYTQGMGLTIAGDEDRVDGIEGLGLLCDETTACVVVQNPDFLGRIAEPGQVAALARRAHAVGALLIVVANPISLGLLVPPGEMEADVVAGEGQALGNHLSFGGPCLGFFAFRRDQIRKSSGRIAGQTEDHDGRRGFVFTLSTREQHIRREKATSNICTNQSLNALTAAVYMTALGPRGLRRVAELCWHKAHYAASRIAAVSGYVVAPGEFFHEFAVRCPRPVQRISARLYEKHGIIGGYDLGADYPELGNAMLLCCTEVNTKEQIDRLVDALEDCRHA